MPKDFDDKRDVSKHILPASSNLLGLCFIMISVLKLFKMEKGINLILDKLIGISIVLFLIASMLSYVSMRARKRAYYYERIADIVFLIGLFSLTIISLMIALEVL